DHPEAARVPRSGRAAPLVLDLVVVAALQCSLEPDRSLAGVGHGAGQRLATVRGRDVHSDRVLAGAAAYRPFAAYIPRGGGASPLVLDLVVVAALDAALEADRSLAGVGHGAGQRLATVRRRDVQSDRVLTRAGAYDPFAALIPGSRGAAPLVLHLVKTHL